MAKAPTTAQRARWGRIAALGCLACRDTGYHDTPAEIHHCGTGAGGRKDHDKVIPLCLYHHRGSAGIDGKRMSKKRWQEIFGTEDYFMNLVATLLGEV